MRPRVIPPLTVCAIAMSMASPAVAEVVPTCVDASLESGRIKCSMAELSEAIRLAPQLPIVYVMRGRLFLDQNDLVKAHADFTEAIRQNPEFALAYEMRGRTYQRAGQFQDAIGDLDEAIKLSPKVASAYAYRGLAYEDKGERDRALADLDRALALSPDPIPPVPVIQEPNQIAREGRDRLRAALSGR